MRLRYWLALEALILWTSLAILDYAPGAWRWLVLPLTLAGAVSFWRVHLGLRRRAGSDRSS